MIVNTMYNLIYNLVSWQMSILPSIPALPQEYITMMNSYIDIMMSGIGLIRYVYSNSLFNFIIGLGIALLGFDYAYSMIMWILRKIPFVAIE
jgi:hypothetical protein